MHCKEVAGLLDGFRTRELDRYVAEQVTAHLTTCAGCSREVAAIAGLAKDLGALRVMVPATILEGVLAKTWDRYSDLETELGRLWVGFNTRGVTMVLPQASDSAGFESAYQHRYGRRPVRGALPESYASPIRRAAAGTATSRVHVDLSAISDFDQTVLLLLRKIPRGEVRPYSWVAREAGSPQAVRAVGNAMARNPVPILLPCHRVVPSAGGIGNYAFGAAMKRELLAREGAPIDQIEEYAKEGVRYIGCKSTGIYCLPTCHDAQRVRRENRILLAGLTEAAGSGFRPCRHCRP